MKTLLKLCLFFSAGILLAGCSDKDDATPSYKTPEGLHAITYYDAYNYQYNFSACTRWWDQIIFYSDTFPVTSLVGAEVTCHLFEANPYFNLLKDYPEPIPCMSLTLSEKDFQATVRDDLTGVPILPGCGNDGHMLTIYLQLLPDFGDYDMYFTFENPSKDIYYRTPMLRYSYIHNIGYFATIITPIKLS